MKGVSSRGKRSGAAGNVSRKRTAGRGCSGGVIIEQEDKRRASEHKSACVAGAAPFSWRAPAEQRYIAS